MHEGEREQRYFSPNPWLGGGYDRRVITNDKLVTCGHDHRHDRSLERTPYSTVILFTHFGLGELAVRAQLLLTAQGPTYLTKLFLLAAGRRISHDDMAHDEYFVLDFVERIW